MDIRGCVKVITLNDKQKIIISYLKENLSQREIYRKTGIARDTIRKYVREYENKVQQLVHSLTGVDKVDLIEDITKSPKYRSSERTKTAITYEVLDKLKAFLKENETKRLTGFSKQQMEKIDMYESLNKDGFNVSYSSIVNAVNKLEKKRKEAYIRQEYIPRDVVEFDFGTVKLYTESIN